MGPSGRITHVIGYIGLYCTVWNRICRFCIWVELPAQRRLCPIFVKSVGSPDIHEYSAGLRVVNGPPGFGASHTIGYSIEYLCSYKDSFPPQVLR